MTDAAPYDKIAKTLIPAPGPGTYVREMYRAASVRALSPFDDRYRPAMEYRHLLAKNYDPAAVAWYLQTKLRQNTAGTIEWFRSSASDVAAVFGQGSPKEEAELIGLLAATLAEEGGDEGLKTALWLITQAVPEANRAAVVESGGARRLSGLLSSPIDAANAILILDWIAAAKPTYAGFTASNLHPDLPAEVQSKAAAHRKSLPKTEVKSPQG
ncbi:hypothetical protein EON82_14905 [bacterium]|nr:MAG: hypothetical protein EON82_14905 [bacterium]